MTRNVMNSQFRPKGCSAFMWNDALEKVERSIQVKTGLFDTDFVAWVSQSNYGVVVFYAPSGAGIDERAAEFLKAYYAQCMAVHVATRGIRGV